MSIPRRRFLKNAAAGAGTLIFAPKLMANAKAVDKTLTIALPNNPSTLDPFTQANHDALVLTQSIFENLVATDVDGNIVPQLAKELPQVSEDEMEYVFTLREGVKFHNGKILDAEDVKYSFDWVINPENNALRYPLFNRISEVQVIDPLTVKFILSKPYRPWLSYMMKYMGIIPKGSREELGLDHFKNNPIGVGTGPAKFVEWRKDDRIVLERNEEYWEPGVPQWERLVARIIPNESSRLAYLLTNKVDIISAPSPKDFMELSEKEGIATDSKTALGGWFFLLMNNKVEPFDDANIRRAVACAIDREMLSEHAYYGLVAPATIPASPESWWFDESANEINTYDPVRARQLVQESKYANNCEFDMLIPPHPYLVDVRDAALIIQAQLAEIGITVHIKELEQGVLLEQLRNGTFSAALQVWMSPGEPTYMIDIVYGKDNVFSKSVGWQNEEVWNLIEETYRYSDEEKLKTIFSDLLNILAVESPHVWLGFVSATNAWREDIKDFEVNQGLTMRVKNVEKL